MQVEYRFVHAYKIVQTVRTLVRLFCSNLPRLNVIGVVVAYGLGVDQVLRIANAFLDGDLDGTFADWRLETGAFAELVVEVGDGDIRLKETRLKPFQLLFLETWTPVPAPW